MSNVPKPRELDAFDLALADAFNVDLPGGVIPPGKRRMLDELAGKAPTAPPQQAPTAPQPETTAELMASAKAAAAAAAADLAAYKAAHGIVDAPPAPRRTPEAEHRQRLADAEKLLVDDALATRELERVAKARRRLRKAARGGR